MRTPNTQHALSFFKPNSNEYESRVQPMNSCHVSRNLLSGGRSVFRHNTTRLVALGWSGNMAGDSADCTPLKCQIEESAAIAH